MLSLDQLPEKCKLSIEISDILWEINDSNQQEILEKVEDAINKQIFSVENILKIIENIVEYRMRNLKNIFSFIKLFLAKFNITPTKNTFNNEVIQVLLL